MIIQIKSSNYLFAKLAADTVCACVRVCVRVRVCVCVCADLRCYTVAFSENHRFYSYANWLVPGKVMLGRYPFIEPNRCRWAPRPRAVSFPALGASTVVFLFIEFQLFNAQVSGAR
jgi:hypothetical protein